MEYDDLAWSATANNYAQASYADNPIYGALPRFSNTVDIFHIQFVYTFPEELIYMHDSTVGDKISSTLIYPVVGDSLEINPDSRHIHDKQQYER